MISAKKNSKKNENLKNNENTKEIKNIEIFQNNGCDDIDQYFGCKYLTSSELLSLQIRDPYFRQQLAAQILFYVNFLR